MTRVRNRVRNQEGISIIEVLVSTTLFLVLAAALAAATVASIRGNKTSRDSATASALAQDMIEWFRAQDPFTLGPLFDAQSNEGTEVVNELGEADVNGRFTRHWVATRNNPSNGMDLLTITVSWNGPDAHEMTALTYVCEHPTCT